MADNGQDDIPMQNSDEVDSVTFHDDALEDVEHAQEQTVDLDTKRPREDSIDGEGNLAKRQKTKDAQATGKNELWNAMFERLVAYEKIHGVRC
jgi:hypothetical protein